MIVWTIDGRNKTLDLQWLEPPRELYRFGVKLTRACYENEKRSGELERTIDWELTDDALEGLFADPFRHVVLEGFSPREEIVRLAACAPIGEIVRGRTPSRGAFRVWKRILKPGEVLEAPPAYRGVPYFPADDPRGSPGTFAALRAAALGALRR